MSYEFELMNMKQLKNYIRVNNLKNKIKGYSKMKRADLLNSVIREAVPNMVIPDDESYVSTETDEAEIMTHTFHEFPYRSLDTFITEFPSLLHRGHRDRFMNIYAHTLNRYFRNQSDSQFPEDKDAALQFMLCVNLSNEPIIIQALKDYLGDNYTHYVDEISKIAEYPNNVVVTPIEYF